jgi:hypothetical protein
MVTIQEWQLKTIVYNANSVIKQKAHKLPKNIKRSINFKQYIQHFFFPPFESFKIN